MPQVKGKGTCLSNIRQQPDTVKNVGIDDSDPRIENELVKENMRQELEEIHLQAHRALADRIHDLDQTRKDVDHYRQLQAMAGNKNVEVLLQGRREKSLSAHLNRKGQDSSSLMNQPRAKSCGPIRKPTKGFSNVTVVEEDENDFYYRRQSTTMTRLDTTVLEPTTTAHPSRSRRRAKTPHPARSIRQIRQALEEEFSMGRKVNRPNTTLGFSQNGSIGPHEGLKHTEEPCVGYGRSFSEFKGQKQSHKIHSTHIMQQRHRLRETQRMEEEQRLQQKMKKFYQNLETFKRGLNR